MVEVGQKSNMDITPEMAAILERPAQQAVAGDDLLEKVMVPKPDKQRHFIAAFMFSFYFGMFGVDRFYMGKYFSGILKLLSLGGLGIWAVIDLLLIISGATKDRYGNPLIGYKEYKSFAKKTIAWTFFAALVLMIMSTIALYLSLPALEELETELRQNYVEITNYNL